jgi:hypothetical protein
MQLISLSQGQFATVDDDFYEVIVNLGYRYHACWNKPTQSFYASRHARRENGRMYTHRLHWDIVGYPLEGFAADHINGDTLDNRRENLRIVSHAQNNSNQRRRKDNRSGYRGVQQDRNRWAAKITVGGKTHHIGCFGTAEEAARAYDAASLDLHGVYGRRNFP